ncbi:hypothetical protein HO133_003268 [Letharia lupina]|uniref:Peroxisomal membrane protein 4 n=1 Tax=Letharia lupina TaxID=560253 RepID=A0A8H6CAZ0_9LECA|nr:uncharacterized protein HO133_003268 [Letharia lupina]KAF6220137.1 hypothetical protein HO133_003268 [Letharia lupina]
MDAVKETVNNIILNPQYADYLALVKAARNGAVYGAKVRFPHALVMVFLFRSDPVREKLHLIYKATRTHARNLASFAVVYKFSMICLRRTSPTGKERSFDTFLAGLIGGYTVFGRGIQSSVNQQIVIYVFARVMLALAKLTVQRKSQGGVGMGRELREKVEGNAWPVFASLSWAAVMWIFRWYPATIQPSLRSSMQYIYVDSDYWDNFKNFLVYNK